MVVRPTWIRWAAGLFLCGCKTDGWILESLSPRVREVEEEKLRDAQQTNKLHCVPQDEVEEGKGIPPMGRGQAIWCYNPCVTRPSKTSSSCL